MDRYYPGSDYEIPVNKMCILVLECLSNHHWKENIGKILIEKAEFWGAADFNEVQQKLAGWQHAVTHWLWMKSNPLKLEFKINNSRGERKGIMVERSLYKQLPL